MGPQNTVEKIGDWTAEQLREVVLDVVRSIRPERDFYEEFEESTAGRIVKIEADLSALKDLTLRGFAEQEKRFLAEMGSLRSEMQTEVRALRSEMQTAMRGLARWIKTSLAVLVPLILAMLGFLIMWL